MPSRALNTEECGQYSLHSSLMSFWEQKIGHSFAIFESEQFEHTKTWKLSKSFVEVLPRILCIFSFLHPFFLWSDSFPPFQSTYEHVYFIPSSLIILTIFILFWDMAHTVVQNCRAFTMYSSLSSIIRQSLILNLISSAIKDRNNQTHIHFFFLTLFPWFLSFFSPHPKFGIGYLSFFGYVLCL